MKELMLVLGVIVAAMLALTVEPDTRPSSVKQDPQTGITLYQCSDGYNGYTKKHPADIKCK